MKRRKMLGFTLVELMIVVSIIAILAAFGYPAYVDQVRKARRADAKTSLQALRINQAKWRANNPTYAASVASVSPTGAAASNDGHYTLAIVGGTATATGFRATATPASVDQAKDKCKVLAITQDGPTGTDATLSTGDWKQQCWL